MIDAVVQPEDLRAELVRRFALYAGRAREWPAKHNAVTPVCEALVGSVSRPMKRALLAIALLLLAARAAGFGARLLTRGPGERQELPDPSGFMVGPFFASKLRARNASCSLEQTSRDVHTTAGG